MQGSRDARELGEGEDDGPRIGEIAVRKGYLHRRDLERALREQRVLEESGRSRDLGEVLVERGYLSPWELEDVILTLADLLCGVDRTGETPSEALPLRLDRGPDPGDASLARSYPRSVAVARPRVRAADVAAPAPWIARDALLGDALALAFERGADVLLVEDDEGEVAGVLPVWDVCQDDPELQVARVLSPLVPAVSDATPLDAVGRLLRERDLPCVAVHARGEILGVVTRRGLRRAGVETDDEAVPEIELGVAG